MTLADVEKIVGYRGKLATGNEDIQGLSVPTIPGEQVYYWQNKDGSSANVLILNGRVVGMSETGLI